eukprot:TRINITY_DN8226_c0_g1_i1.p1 TRINITY_DN8226_c0_g1~~TRINITY_DN8226_c0_g1_i1.p1  ORF type:complete len:179 (+),score=30.92 TRINITY_DN8226_c0_g1_i1:128-664(+)
MIVKNWYQFEDVPEEDLNKISEIIPNSLYITNRTSAENKQQLDELGITHILNISSTNKPFAQFFTYFCIGSIIDNESDAKTLKLFLPEINEFIHKAIMENKKVLVHCAAGVSRSATAIIGYLMIKWQLSLKNALKICKYLRPAMWPNRGFLDMLMEVEHELYGKFTLERVVSTIREAN